ncbi:MAG: hypothetical protein ACR2LC_11925 [Pyrinomonadaceae bacterium]
MLEPPRVYVLIFKWIAMHSRSPSKGNSKEHSLLHTNAAQRTASPARADAAYDDLSFLNFKPVLDDAK